MKKNVEGLVSEYLGNLVKVNVGLSNDKYEFVVIYEDDYSIRNEYSFQYDKENEETLFGGNISRSRFGKYSFDRNEAFEEEMILNIMGSH